MIIIPAIDLLDGRVVRLRHGDFNERTFYDVEPAELADRYHAQGAEWLHVVDLEASRHGAAADTSDLFELLSRTVQSVQTGGGVRSGGDVRARLESGAKRVVVGSLCVTETERFLRWISELGAERVVAAVDVQIDRAGVPRPRIHGTENSAAVTRNSPSRPPAASAR
ncbi:MAG: HisA/HisF-related TIM barrel protein [Gammaproteobacteria bacterium]